MEYFKVFNLWLAYAFTAAMDKMLKYKVLFAANLTVSGVVTGFALAVNLTGLKLVIAILIISSGVLCALAMYLVIHRIRKDL